MELISGQSSIKAIYSIWKNIPVKKTTLEPFRLATLAGFFACTSAEWFSLLPSLQSRLCKAHRCQKVSTFCEESQQQKDRSGHATTRLGLRVSHLTVIRLTACSFILFLHHCRLVQTVILSLNPWQRRNKPHKDLISEFCFIFRFAPHAPLYVWL